MYHNNHHISSLIAEDDAALVEVNERLLAVVHHPLPVAVEVLRASSHAVYHFVGLGVSKQAKHSKAVVVLSHHWRDLRPLSLRTRFLLLLEALLLHGLCLLRLALALRLFLLLRQRIAVRLKFGQPRLARPSFHLLVRVDACAWMEVLIVRVDERIRIGQLRMRVVVGAQSLLAVKQIFEFLPSAFLATVILP